MEGNWGDSNFKSFTELSIPHQAAEVVGTVKCSVYIYICISGILSTPVSFWMSYLKNNVTFFVYTFSLFLQVHLFHVCYIID